jgi:hypothetical protein
VTQLVTTPPASAKLTGRPGGLAVQPFRAVPGGHEQQGGGVGADAVKGEQPGVTVTGGTIRSSSRSIWASRNSSGGRAPAVLCGAP